MGLQTVILTAISQLFNTESDYRPLKVDSHL